MNILIVSQYFWPEDFRVNEIAFSLVKRGHNVTVLTAKPNYPRGQFYPGFGWFKKCRQEYNGVQIIRVPIVPRGNSGFFRLIFNYISFAISASLLGPLQCRADYEVIFVHEASPVTVGIPAIVMKWIHSVPILFWILDLWPESLSAVGMVNSPKILRLVGYMVDFIYSQSDQILIQSELFSSSVEKYGVPSKKIKFFPNSAEELFKPVSMTETLKRDFDLPDGFIVMFAGNIGSAQDFPMILDAAERLKEQKDIHWIVLGEGRMYSWVIEEIKKRSLVDNVHLLGRHSMEKMPYFFALADVMLVTLKQDPVFTLTIPAKVQAYMACAKPIVAGLDGAGARVIRDSGCGVVAEPGNSQSLSTAVINMYNMSSADRTKMGQSGKKYYDENFEHTLLVDRLESWMRDLVA